MGRKNLKEPASDQVSPRKARKTSSHRSSSSTCSSSAQSGVEPFQKPTQGARVISETPASDWKPTVRHNQSDIQRVPMPAFAALQLNAKLGQRSIHGKKLRRLAPNPTPFPRARTPEPESITTEDGRLKYRIPRIDPPPAIVSAFPRTAAPSTDQELESPEPQEPIPSFDPSKCIWGAVRDVAFVKDRNIDISTEELCALLRFRYAKEDPQMERVEEWHVDAMDEYRQRERKEMYEKGYPMFVGDGMKKDLKLMAEEVKKAVGEKVVNGGL